MADESRLPLSELRPGETVQVKITGHRPWGLMAELNGYEPVGASLDTIRRSSEPGVKRLAQELPPAGTTVDLVIGEVRAWHREPWIWVDLTAPGPAEYRPCPRRARSSGNTRERRSPTDSAQHDGP